MNVHQRTPNLSVIDPRSLVVRSVDYHRDSVEPTVDSRITRQTFDALGRLRESWDPRLWLAAPRPNLTTLYGLNGQPLLTDSVDAGWQLSLFNQTGSGCLFWDARGTRRQCEYDDQQRPVCVSEQMIGEPSCVVERFDYAGSSLDFTIHNQCGRLIRHDDPAGFQVFPDYGLACAVLVEERRFLIELETPDWPEQPHERDTWLEDQRFITRHDFSAAGELRHQTDAMNNVQTFAYDVAGRLSETWLRLAGDGTQSQRLISDIRYNAHDQIESETAGNGVVTRAEYSADDGRLVRLIAQVRDQKPLQDLHYRYDPVGNIVELEDQSQAVSHFNNQRIEPINRYRYDSLYQLVEASGWEVSQPSHGPALPDLLPTPLDPTQRRNYTQRFEYDPAGNLITRHHSGAPGFSMFTSTRSNRSLAQREDGSLPGEAEIDSGFDACGSQQELQRGQAMTWDSRNQLSRVTMVKRANEPDDDECYAYDRPGHRLRKVHVSQTSNQTLRTEVRYLPGLEIHRQPDGEEHHVISVEAGRCSVRVLHWPDGAHADQLRYSLCDHLGSSTVELDHEAGVLTQEHYYAFGGTACWAGKGALVAKYKTIRYSGKERDATGLYYYGYRYYAPWLQRWASADPLGVVDGLNMYWAFNDRPIIFLDCEGTAIFNFLDEPNKSIKPNQADKVRIVVNYEIPEMHHGASLVNYLEQSKPGNSFAGIINVSSGEVNIYPLSLDRADGNSDVPIPAWKKPYSGIMHDGGRPIVHKYVPKNTLSGAPKLTSHRQAVNIFSKTESMEIGFTLNDIRDIPIESDEEWRKIRSIKGTSRTLNTKKTFRVPDDFVSIGTNKQDYEKAAAMRGSTKDDSSGIVPFEELSIEVKRKLINMFVKISDMLSENSLAFKQLFEDELLRPELQVTE